MFAFVRSPLFALAALAQIGGGAVLAHAEDARSATVMVKTADLNLRTESGAATLRRRVSVAARSVCGPTEMIGSPDFSSYSQCVDQAQKQASIKSAALIASARSSSQFASAQ